MSEIVNFTDYILFNKNSKIIMSENPITLVLGASENPGRYSHMAVNKLRAYGHNVIALGKNYLLYTSQSLGIVIPAGSRPSYPLSSLPHK